MDDLGRLLLDGLDHPRGAVAQISDANPRREVEELGGLGIDGGVAAKARGPTGRAQWAMPGLGPLTFLPVPASTIQEPIAWSGTMSDTWKSADGRCLAAMARASSRTDALCGAEAPDSCGQ